MGNIIFGILMLIGGLSGSMALRGTGSPLALAGFGVILCLFGVYQLTAGKKEKRPRTGRQTRRSRR